MAFSFNFVVNEDGSLPVAGDSRTSEGLGFNSEVNSTVSRQAPSVDGEENTHCKPLAGKRLLLDACANLDMTVPSCELPISMSDGSHKKFIRIDEERANIGEDLVELLFDDETQAHKDLIPNKYEGGLKIWEASLDLVRLLHRMLKTEKHPLFHGAGSKTPAIANLKAKVSINGALPVANTDLDFSDGQQDNVGENKITASALDNSSVSKGRPLRVLELGCGHGFPGTYVLQEANVQFCVFSDYNEAVLKAVTWPTVLLNCLGHGGSEQDVDLRFRARYYAGDWDSVSPLLIDDDNSGSRAGEEGRFELILTAETLYTPEICRYVERLIRRHLSKNAHSMALVAAKRFYFGTGGSTAIFKQAIVDANKAAAESAGTCKDTLKVAGAGQSSNATNILDVRTLESVSDGRSNIRDILCVSWVRSNI